MQQNQASYIQTFVCKHTAGNNFFMLFVSFNNVHLYIYILHVAIRILTHT